MKLDKVKRLYGENVKWFGKKCICGLPISFTTYILTDEKLITRVGLINLKEDEIELYKVTDKEANYPLGQRIVGCGTIRLMSVDKDTPTKELKSIKKPREVKQLIDELVGKQRDKYLVRGRDMIGISQVDCDCLEGID